MKSNLFNPDSDLSRAFSFIFDIICLSLAWFIASLGIITFGLSTTALYYATFKISFKKKNNPLSEFFYSFKQNIKVGLLSFLIILFFSLALIYAMYIIYQMMVAGNLIAYVLFYFGLVICFYLLGLYAYIYPTLANYKYGIKDLFIISFKLSIAHLPITLLFSLLYVICILAIYYFWPILLVLAGLLSYIKCKILNKIYQKHTN